MSHHATITRPHPRGDWYARVPVAAFPKTGDGAAVGSFVRIDGDTAVVRFGGRGGAMIAAVPDARRAAAVVASVRAMRAAVSAGYVNDARPGAVSSVAVTVGIIPGATVADGGAARRRIGRIPASRRVAAAPRVTAAVRKRVADRRAVSAPAPTAPAPETGAPAAA